MASNCYKHMNIEDRQLIEKMLNNSEVTLKQIALSLNRDPKTIREEIKSHRYLFISANRQNKCGKQEVCDQMRLCTRCVHGKCRFCRHQNCNELCDSFTPEPVCPRTDRFPYVCSGCPELAKCKLPKFLYKAETARGERDTNVREWKFGHRNHRKL